MDEEQARAFIDGAGLVRRDSLVSYRVFGVDAVDYLHRMTTQDIAALAPGTATHACLLNVRGRILGDLLVWRPGQEVMIEFEAEARDAVISVLEKFVILDDVSFEDVTPRRARFLLAGPDAASALRTAGLDVPAAGAVAECEVGGEPAWIVRLDRGTLPTFDISVHPDAATDLEERLQATELATVCEADAWDAARVHCGVPRFGAELGEDVMFNEAQFEQAVSWKKGCYPGQEPVVMAKHRGHPPRLLVVLAVDGDRAPAPGSELHKDGAKVGTVTSSAPALAGRPPAALGYVRHGAVERGATLDVRGGGRATIVG